MYRTLIIVMIFVIIDNNSLADERKEPDFEAIASENPNFPVEFSPDLSVSESTDEATELTEPAAVESQHDYDAVCTEWRRKICDETDAALRVNNAVRVGDNILAFFWYFLLGSYRTVPLLMRRTAGQQYWHIEEFNDWNKYNQTYYVEEIVDFYSGFSLRKQGSKPGLSADQRIILYINRDHHITAPYLMVYSVLYSAYFDLILNFTAIKIDQYRVDKEKDVFHLHDLYAHFPSQLQFLARPAVAFPINDPTLPNRVFIYFEETNPRQRFQTKQMVHIFIEKEVDGKMTWVYDKNSGECILLSNDQVMAAVPITDIYGGKGGKKQFDMIEFYKSGEFSERRVEVVGDGVDSAITPYSFDVHNVGKRYQIRDLLRCDVCFTTNTNEKNTKETRDWYVSDTTETSETTNITSTMSATEEKENKSKKVWLWILLIIAILLIIGGIAFAVYWFAFREKRSQKRDEDIEMSDLETPSPRSPSSPSPSTRSSPSPRYEDEIVAPPLPTSSPPHSTPSTPKSCASEDGKPSTPTTTSSRHSPSSSPKNKGALNLDKPDDDIPFIDE